MAQPALSGVTLPDGGKAPALGQGSWHLAQGRHPAAQEEAALRTGISLGMTLIDTAELYGEGRAERMIGRVVAGQRERFIAITYRFFTLNLAVFMLLLTLATPAQHIWIGRLFFIWVSVFNLFVVSVFWSFIVDVFDAEQGKRLFGFLAGGGRRSGASQARP